MWNDYGKRWEHCSSAMIENSRILTPLLIMFLSNCYNFRIKMMFGSSLISVICRRVQVLFTLFVFVCVLTVCVAYRCLVEGGSGFPFEGVWVHLWYLLNFLIFCVVFFGLFVFALCLVSSMLPVSLDCSFLIAISVFSNVYFNSAHW